MSRYSGGYFPGARADERKKKHAEAEERNTRTPYLRTRQYRRSHVEQPDVTR